MRRRSAGMRSRFDHLASVRVGAVGRIRGVGAVDEAKECLSGLVEAGELGVYLLDVAMHQRPGVLAGSSALVFQFEHRLDLGQREPGRLGTATLESLSCGSTSASTSSIPISAATAPATCWASPVIIITLALDAAPDDEGLARELRITLTIESAVFAVVVVLTAWLVASAT